MPNEKVNEFVVVGLKLKGFGFAALFGVPCAPAVENEPIFPSFDAGAPKLKEN